MNKLERQMVSVLEDLKANHNVVGIKAEFEAEGTRMEEAMRLKDVVTSAGLTLTVKIGGCEAVKDMYDAKTLGVERIVAPMIESSYAMTKYIKAAKMVFHADEECNVKYLINVETKQGLKQLDEILASEASDDLSGIVLGRVDMTGSMGLSRDDINSKQLFDIACEVATKCKDKGIECIIGGGVSSYSLPFFRDLPNGTLARYETRKVIFKCPEALSENAPAGILKAVGFELMWLKNKRDFYGNIFAEDKNRIEMLEARWKKLIEEAGGNVGNL